MRVAALMAWGQLEHVCDERCLTAKPEAVSSPSGPGDYIICPQCERRDPNCPACGGHGLFKIPCARRFVDQMTWDVIDAADLIKATGWPGGKGWADEPAALVDAVQWVWSEYGKIEADLIKEQMKR